MNVYNVRWCTICLNKKKSSEIIYLLFHSYYVVLINSTSRVQLDAPLYKVFEINKTKLHETFFFNHWPLTFCLVKVLN